MQAGARPQPSVLAMGDEPSWGRLVPAVWQALADPGGSHVYPPQGPGLEGATEWWSPLLHVLWFSLGWPRPDAGLRRWYDAGKPSEDPRFQLIKGMWGSRLNLFAAWCWECSPLYSQMLSARLETEPDRSPAPVVDDEWRRAAEVLRARSPLSPWTGDADGLHLYAHAMTAVVGDSDQPAVLVTDRADRRAALVLDGYAGWYGRLARVGRELPTLPRERSWRVDVVVRPVGWLGTFRRSRTTGRWFSGRHRVHEMGAPLAHP